MTNINHIVDADARTGQIQAVLRVTGRVITFSKHGVPHLKLRLESCHTRLIGFLNMETHSLPEDIGYLELVRVRGYIVTTRTKRFLLVDHLGKADRETRRKLPALETLPQSCAADSQSLETLVHWVRNLDNPHLQAFVRHVLERRDRLEVFLRAPASRRYHHSYPGGLLDHSLEVSRAVMGMVQLHEPDSPQDLKEAGFVAGLLHDIGKVFTFNAAGEPTAAARLSDHDAFTLEACATGLAYLDQHQPQLAMTLRHVWSCASPGARYGSPAAMTLARYVRDADGQNAMVANQRLAFQSRQHSGFAQIGRNQYWQPRLDQ